MSETINNGWPPFVAPESNGVARAPAKETALPPAPRSFLGDLLCWWRSARERKLIARIRVLKLALAMEKEENMRLAEMIEHDRRWIQASTATAERICNSLGVGGVPEQQKRLR